MKKSSLFNKILLLGILTVGLILVFSYVVYAKQNSVNNIKYQFVSDIKKTTHDLKALEKAGNKLENASISTKINPEQAVELASKYRPDYASQATDVVVEYYQLTNTAFNAFSDSTKNNNKYLSKDGFLEKAPCYIVSFKGITRVGKAPEGMQAPIFHEYNVVIDADLGEVLFSFAYR
ncbi:hypothetical protein [Pelotomaculum propionicicum]|uniref:Uncharacterized protein n=1 Tax=Pelotomaculum propionicicum TaxID=258475 RepID=A0A4Y7RP68_9FIRM|nr:hypothetical protein [Pelotomaculum propionicicum]NLI11656.1 hypothetical protein [Peptococcaceae bacterium]TEB10794.1 hypothetical protein Pmgp_02109 [Pelotomaculum propionicicum]